MLEDGQPPTIPWNLAAGPAARRMAATYFGTRSGLNCTFGSSVTKTPGLDFVTSIAIRAIHFQRGKNEIHEPAVAGALLLAAGTAAPAVASTGAQEPGGTPAYASYEDAVPGVAPAEASETAVFLDEAGRVIAMEGSPVPESSTSDTQTGEAQAAAIGCTPVSGRDNPHRSSTGVAVSAHGWWNKGDCSNNRANVYNCIYEWYSDNTWRRKDCSVTKELRPRKDGGGRTTARRNCDNTALTSWRNHVDVDVIGEIDTAEKPMRQQDVYCRVF